MLESIFAFVLQLPLGLLLAAGLVEIFVLHRDRREVEPAVLWLLFCACVLGALMGGIHFLRSGSPDFCVWVGFASGLAALAFWFKRQARNRGVSSLRDRFIFEDTHVPAMVPHQVFYLLGFRSCLLGALILSVASLFFAKSISSSPQADTDTLAATTQSTPKPSKIVAEPTAPTPESKLIFDAAAPPPAAEPIPVPDPTKPAEPVVAKADPPAVVPAPTTPAPTPAPAPVMPEARPISKNSSFASRIRPVIQRQCVSCHGPEKQKGDLRLDTPDHIRGGVRGKAVILAGKPEQSTLFQAITKPVGDDDRMPPKGAGVSPSDVAIIKKWITDGADMGDGVSTPSASGISFSVDALAAKLQAPPAPLLEELKKEGVLVRPISKDGKVVEIDFSHADHETGAMKLERLVPIAANIQVLDLSRTGVTDGDLVHLSGMIHLSRLILSKTDISDAGMAHLQGLAGLEYLNIYQTKVSDAGLTHLEKLSKLNKLYAWQSMVTPEGANTLRSKKPGLAINMGQ